MNFLSPTSLLLFGMAIPIVALFILKLRRRREPVPTLMFWEELFSERQTTSLFQRLKHLLSLFLQLLFLALLVFAIAQPQFTFLTKSARQIVLIIDQSASMNTVEGSEGSTRLDAAKEHALRIVEGLRFMDEMAVLSSHKRPIIHTPWTNHQKSLKAAIHAIQPTDIGTNLEPAINLADAIAQTKPNPEILIFSDFHAVSEALLSKLKRGTAEGAGDAEPHQAIKHRLIRVGKVRENVGITQFRVRKSLVNPFDYETLLRVVNASAAEKRFNVELYFEEDLFDVRPWTLAPGESASEIFSNFTFEGGRLKAVLDVNDALSTDNIGYATLPKRERTSVLLVTVENPFLQQALAVDEQIDLTLLTPDTYEASHGLAENANAPETPPEYQLVIFDRYSPATLGDGNYLFIYPPAATVPTELKWLVENGGGEALTFDENRGAIITEWERNHPILRHVHLENVYIGEAYRVTPPATAQILARSFEDPVLFVDTTPNRKIVFAALDILQSDLPLRIAFPVIIANTIQWFQQGSTIQEYTLHTGEVLQQQLEPRNVTSHKRKNPSQDTPKRVTITGPGDETWEIPIERNEILFDRTQRAGFYEVRREDSGLIEANSSIGAAAPVSEEVPSAEEDAGTLWAVNLADEAETHIGADPAVEALLEESVFPRGATLLHYPPWVYLVCIAVVLSSVEWFLYQRRRID